jgi:hypothetical protein
VPAMVQTLMFDDILQSLSVGHCPPGAAVVHMDSPRNETLLD